MNRDRINRAARLYEDFTGHAPREVVTVDTPNHDTQLVVGEVEAIAYNAVRDDERASYIHEFKKHSRPLLTASHDGTSLYLLDGAYRFTDRGITDRKGNPMATIALVNPSRRKGWRKMATRKHRTAAQRAATRKLVALNRARRSGRTTHRRKARRKSSARHVTTPRRHHTNRVNPNPRRRHRARRRNPMGGMLSGAFWMGEVVPTTVGAVGALGIDVAIGYLPLPAIVQTNAMVRNVVKIAGALGLGYLAQMVTTRKTGEEVAAGAIAVTLYDMVKGFLVNSFPTLPIVPTATVVIPTAAATGTTAGIGWTGPAPTVGTYMSAAESGAGEDVYNYEGMGSYINAY